LGGCLTGIALLVIISAMITGPHGLVQYAQFLHDFDIHSGYGSLNPRVMVNLRGFLTGIIGSHDFRAWSLAGDITLMILGMMFLRAVPKLKDQNLFFAFCVALTVIASPYAHFPDMTILILPMLLAIDWVTSRQRWEIQEKFLIFSTATLFCLPTILITFSGLYWWKSKVYLNFGAIFLFLFTLAWNMWTTSFPQPASASPPFATQLPRDHS
jgi:hypothetical protein